MDADEVTERLHLAKQGVCCTVEGGPGGVAGHVVKEIGLLTTFCPMSPSTDLSMG